MNNTPERTVAVLDPNLSLIRGGRSTACSSRLGSFFHIDGTSAGALFSQSHSGGSP